MTISINETTICQIWHNSPCWNSNQSWQIFPNFNCKILRHLPISVDEYFFPRCTLFLAWNLDGFRLDRCDKTEKDSEALMSFVSVAKPSFVKLPKLTNIYLIENSRAWRANRILFPSLFGFYYFMFAYTLLHTYYMLFP